MVPIVYVADQKAVKLVIISASSVIRHNPDAEFIILSESPLEMSQFSYVVRKNYTNYVCPIPTYRANAAHISNAAYLKFKIPEMLANYSRCIYLDADTICQGSLKELSDIAENDTEMLSMCESWSFGKTQAKWHGNEYYYNSGMMAMNLDALRSTGFERKCLGYMNVSIPNFCEDETLINCAMYPRIQRISNRFNYCHNRHYHKENAINEKDAVILHFIGADKSDMIEWGRKNL